MCNCECKKKIINKIMCGSSKLEDFCLRWRMYIRPICISIYILFVLIVVPYIITNSVKDGFAQKDQLILIGGLFVLTAIPVSVWHISQHIAHFTRPILQKHIIRILWMVPIYAFNSVSIFFFFLAIYSTIINTSQ